jgi:hypothetical protein
MGFLILPVLVLIVVAPGAGPSGQSLSQFSRFQQAINREISMVDSAGSVREGVLTAATANDVTMRFQSGERTFQKPDIASAERLTDRRRDGAIKGAIFGAVVGIFAIQGTDTTGQGVAAVIGSTAIYSAVGFGLDAAFKHRQPIYRARPASAPAKKP